MKFPSFKGPLNWKEGIAWYPTDSSLTLGDIVWDETMLPIVNGLQHDLKFKYHSQIWLCPTAAFTFIPLHAAHPFRTKADHSKESYLEDFYICSYMPTLSALLDR
ncbi:hypothetical protein EDB19DRAFT_1388323 [Suillus lakei]|nr:hypothetical protein EDB19DRAFT_1388323 [Suillus lakei]